MLEYAHQVKVLTTVDCLVSIRDSLGSIEGHHTIGGQGEYDQTEDGLHDAYSLDPGNHIDAMKMLCVKGFCVERRNKGKREVNKGSNYKSKPSQPPSSRRRHRCKLGKWADPCTH